jgi:hypothetical protein
MAMATGRDEQEVLDRERQRFAAMVRKDAAFLNQVRADDLVYTHSSGNVDTKTSFIDSLTSGRLAYDAAVPEGLGVRLFGDVAVLTGTAQIRVHVQAKPLDLRIRFTDVYVKRLAGWQVVAWQATRRPE